MIGRAADVPNKNTTLKRTGSGKDSSEGAYIVIGSYIKKIDIEGLAR